MKVTLTKFGGLMPRIDPTLLPESAATVAHNCRLKSGKINSIQHPLSVTDRYTHMENGIKDVRDANTLYLWKRSLTQRDFIVWPGFVQVAKSNIFNDKRFRIFATGETGFGDEENPNQPIAYITDTTGHVFDRHFLYKEPLPLPIVYLQSSLSDPVNLRYTYFFQTWVDEYGYESGSSTQSQEIVYNDGQTIVIEGCEAAPDAVSRRIYKAIAGTETETVRFVFEQTRIGSGGFLQTTFTVKDEDTGEELPRITSIPQDLVWMTEMPGNFYAGFRRGETREVCFSDVNLPTSWPDEFRYAVRDEVVGFGVSGTTLFVLTNGFPYAITGTAPSTMAATQIASQQACVSNRSICSSGGNVFYASQDGICVLSEGSSLATVMTKDYFDKETWEALNPSSALMACYDNALVVWFTRKDGSAINYIIDFDESGGLVITTHDDTASAFYVDVSDDKLYFVG